MHKRAGRVRSCCLSVYQQIASLHCSKESTQCHSRSGTLSTCPARKDRTVRAVRTITQAWAQPANSSGTQLFNKGKWSTPTNSTLSTAHTHEQVAASALSWCAPTTAAWAACACSCASFWRRSSAAAPLRGPPRGLAAPACPAATPAHNQD